MTIPDRRFYPLLGELLAYPDQQFRSRSAQARAHLEKRSRELTVRFDRFHQPLAALQMAQLEELYSRTFDLNCLCVPYVSVHLFGEENLKRSRLMVALSERYSEWNFDPGTELPDHLSLVLRATPHFAPEEWQDFLTYCLVPAVGKMSESLSDTDNPFRHLLEILFEMLQGETLLEIVNG